MRYYSKRRPQNIIIPIYPAAVFAGDQLQKLGDIKYIYYLDGTTYTQATGVYAESSGGTITCQAGQSILTINPANESFYYITISYDSTIAQTIETVQGRYYFVIPSNRAYVALEDGTIVASLRDVNSGATTDPIGSIGLDKAMYGLNVQLE